MQMEYLYHTASFRTERRLPEARPPFQNRTAIALVITNTWALLINEYY